MMGSMAWSWAATGTRAERHCDSPPRVVYHGWQWVRAGQGRTTPLPDRLR